MTRDELARQIAEKLRDAIRIAKVAGAGVGATPKQDLEQALRQQLSDIERLEWFVGGVRLDADASSQERLQLMTAVERELELEAGSFVQAVEFSKLGSVRAQLEYQKFLSALLSNVRTR